MTFYSQVQGELEFEKISLYGTQIIGQDFLQNPTINLINQELFFTIDLEYNQIELQKCGVQGKKHFFYY